MRVENGHKPAIQSRIYVFDVLFIYIVHRYGGGGETNGCNLWPEYIDWYDFIDKSAYSFQLHIGRRITNIHGSSTQRSTDSKRICLSSVNIQSESYINRKRLLSLL